MEKYIPRIIIAGVSSGSGKTSVATGLMKALSDMGLAVQPFKVGPDYIDPGYHKIACGRDSCSLDSCLVPKDRLLEDFAAASDGADIAVIEGVMGLYDGGRNGVSSTAQIAKLLKAPIIIVIDVKSIGASAAAIALGYKEYDKEADIRGTILNRLGSDTHKQMITKAMSDIGIEVLGGIRRNDCLYMPERHLGLVPTLENPAVPVVEKLGTAMRDQLDIQAILHCARSAEPLSISGIDRKGNTASAVRIALAKDEAFSFYYPDSIAELRNQGAEIVYFSPIHDKEVPESDGIILGGGFPEVFAAKLSSNESMRESMLARAKDGCPIYAECGGYMYAMRSIRDFEGIEYPMVGIFDCKSSMTKKLQMVGYIEAELTQDLPIGKKGCKLHGHEFHFSVEESHTASKPAIFTKMRDMNRYYAGQYRYNTFGSYMHMNFFGEPEAASSFIMSCQKYKKSKSAGSDNEWDV